MFGTLTLAAKGLTTGGVSPNVPFTYYWDESFHPARLFRRLSRLERLFIRREMTCSRGCGSGGACSSTQGAEPGARPDTLCVQIAALHDPRLTAAISAFDTSPRRLIRAGERNISRKSFPPLSLVFGPPRPWLPPPCSALFSQSQPPGVLQLGTGVHMRSPKFPDDPRVRSMAALTERGVQHLSHESSGDARFPVTRRLPPQPSPSLAPAPVPAPRKSSDTRA